MTELDKLIASQADDTLISIGSASGFVFVGTKAEWEQDADKLSDSLLQGMIRTARRAQRDYKRLFVAAAKAAAEGVSPSRELLSPIANKLKTYLEYSARAARFVPLRSRSIKERYGGIEAGTLKVIVPGDEYGACWLRDEYVRLRAGL